MGPVAILTDRSLVVSIGYFFTVNRMFVLVIKFPLWSTNRVTGIMTTAAVNFSYIIVGDLIYITMTIGTLFINMNRASQN